MALPPNGLTHLLYRTDLSPDAVITMLRRKGCLADEARRNPDHLRRLLQELVDRENAYKGPPIMGPTLADKMGRLLVESPFLNARGKKLFVSMPEQDDESPDSPGPAGILDRIRRFFSR